MFIKLIRLGKDAELKQLEGGRQVLNFSGAYNVGYGDNKRTQWIDCAIWGDKATAVQQYMTKGTQVVIYGEDLEVEPYNKNDSDRTAGATLKCTVRNFDFAGGNNDSVTPSHQALAPQVAPAPMAAPQAPAPVKTDQQILVEFQQIHADDQNGRNLMWSKLTTQQQATLKAALT